MGVVCCDDLPKLAHEDVGINPRYDPSVPSAAGAATSTGATSSVATLPSDHTADDNGIGPKSSPATDQATKATTIKTNKDKMRQAKKMVRINDEATVIPSLTSASFFRKTPKPTTITSSGHGIMPSFRIVAPAAIASEDGSSDSDDDLVPKASLWWTKEEKREILQANQRASRDFKRFQPSKLRRANLVYNDIVMDCCRRNGSHQNPELYDDNDIYDFFQRQHRNARTIGTSTTGATTTSCPSSTKKRKRADHAPILVNDDNDDNSDADLAPPAIPEATIELPTNVRGLEWGILPDAKRHRKAHVRTVLGWQERFRRMNAHRRRRRHGQDTGEDFDDEEWSSSSYSSSSSDDDDREDGRRFERKSTTCETSAQQDELLGQKASISSLRSCMLGRVLGRSDEIAAQPIANTVSDLEKDRASSSSSPTPSLTGTTDESEISGSDEDDDSDSDAEDDSDSDAEDENENKNENENRTSGRFGPTSGYHPAPLFPRNADSHRRMFRPRMMPPTGWR